MLTAPSKALIGGQAGSQRPLLTVVDRCEWHANGTRGVLACRRTESGYPVTSAGLFRSGRGQGPRWSTPRLNDLDPCPRSAKPPAPA